MMKSIAFAATAVLRSRHSDLRLHAACEPAPAAPFAHRDPVVAAKAGVDSASPAGAIAKALQAGEVDARFFDRKVYHTLVMRFGHGIHDNPTRGKAERMSRQPST